MYRYIHRGLYIQFGHVSSLTQRGLAPLHGLGPPGPPLCTHATRLRHALSVAPTTGAAERNWSAFGFIHCKRRNRLKNDRVEMLVFIYWNLRMLKSVPDFPDRNNSSDQNGGSDGDAEGIETLEGEEYGEDDEEDLYIVDQDLF